jgi:hypothetical protein
MSGFDSEIANTAQFQLELGAGLAMEKVKGER